MTELFTIIDTEYIIDTLIALEESVPTEFERAHEKAQALIAYIQSKCPHDFTIETGDGIEDSHPFCTICKMTEKSVVVNKKK